MNECWVIYDVQSHKFWSDSERVWSVCVGTFFPTEEEAHIARQYHKHDVGRVRTIHFYNY